MKLIRQCNNSRCNQEYQAEVKYLKRGQGLYCSRSCAMNDIQVKRYAKKNLPNVKCAYCGKSFYKGNSRQSNSRNGIFFCSREHKDLGQRIEFGLKKIWPSHYESDSDGSYRPKALRAYGAICKQCGYNETKKMLDVDHIDSNRSNNDLSNLQVLCVWCHALKTRANWPDN